MLFHTIMSRLIPLLLSMLCLPGCVGRRLYHDREVSQNGSYYSGTSIPTVKGIFSKPNADREFRSEDAVVGLLTSAILLAQNPDYYQKSSIGGRCVRGPEEAAPLQLPCMNATFVLVSETGREESRYFSESGAFQFFVEPHTSYSVAVLTKAGRQGKVGPVRMGDEVVIRLGDSETAGLPVRAHLSPGR